MPAAVDKQQATLTLASGTVLSIKSGTVTLSDRWTPYVRAQITIPTPSDINTVDPRDLVTASIVLVQRFGDAYAITSDLSTLFAGGLTSAVTTAWGSQLTSWITSRPKQSYNAADYPATSVALKNLYIRSRRVREDGSTDLELTSAEVALQDLRWGEEWILTARSARTLLEAMRTALVYPDAYTITLPWLEGDALVTGGTVTGDQTDNSIKPRLGSTLWDILSPYLLAGNMRIWVDTDGVYRMTFNDATVAGSVTFDLATAVSYVTDRGLDEWADAVVLEYNVNPNNSGYDTTSAYQPAGYTKTYYEKIETTTPLTPWTAEPDAAAYNMWLRFQKRGHVVDLTTRNDFSVRPGQAATITVGTLPTFTGVVESVAWNIETAEMSVVTRELVEV